MAYTGFNLMPGLQMLSNGIDGLVQSVLEQKASQTIADTLAPTANGKQDKSAFEELATPASLAGARPQLNTDVNSYNPRTPAIAQMEREPTGTGYGNTQALQNPQPTPPGVATFAQFHQGAPTGTDIASLRQTNPINVDVGPDRQAAQVAQQGNLPYDPVRARNAIASIESAGSGDYTARGPAVRRSDGRTDYAYGRYQVMGDNIPSWTREVLGRAMTPQEFLASPAAQDAVFDAKFGQSVQKHGNIADAASVWFTGRPITNASSAARDNLGTSGSDYVRKFAAAYRGGGTQVAQAGASDAPMPGAAQAQGFATPGRPAPQNLQGVEIATPQNIGTEKLRALLLNPQTRDVGLAIWKQQNSQSNDRFKVVTSGDGTIGVLDGRSGGIRWAEGTSKPRDPKVVAAGGALVTDQGDELYRAPQQQTPEQRNFEFGQQNPAFNQWDLDRRKAGAASQSMTVNGERLTPGQAEIDKEFSKDYNRWNTAGQAQTAAQRSQLANSIRILQENPNVTGAIGAFPDWLQPFINPKGTIAREGVEEVVQTSLRDILGAQYTEREGQGVLARAFNPKLSTTENLRRVNLLLQTIETMAGTKQEMVDYFNENGTLRGYKGRRPSIGDVQSLFVNERGDEPSKPRGAPADARQASDGKWYSPDPNRPGKYIRWQ